ncbi:MAG TPA: Crp/Fnr family transcriptional regulator [Pyrinomonadaceae bacterium]|nr:Crp/Fnr family transcriptional regulator [Pyrinomonadaceae bacterium]
MKKLFGNLGSDLKKALEGCGNKRRYVEGEEIFAEGDLAEFLPIVISGGVKMVRSPVVGKEVIIGIFRDGEMFAVPPVFDGGPYPASAFAIKDTVLLQIRRDDYLKLLNEWPEFALATIGWMSEMLREKTSIIRNLAIASPERRIANVLIKLAEAQEGTWPVRIPVRRQDIAEMASLTTETTIRAIRRLADQELLTIVHGKIIINEVESLRHFVES